MMTQCNGTKRTQSALNDSEIPTRYPPLPAIYSLKGLQQGTYKDSKNALISQSQSSGEHYCLYSEARRFKSQHGDKLPSGLQFLSSIPPTTWQDRMLPSICFTNHYSLIILTFDVIWNKLLTASFNKVQTCCAAFTLQHTRNSAQERILSEYKIRQNIYAVINALRVSNRFCLR